MEQVLHVNFSQLKLSGGHWNLSSLANLKHNTIQVSNLIKS